MTNREQKITNLTYPVIIHEENGHYWAEVPDVAGAFTDGNSVEETIVNIKESIELMLAYEDEIPKPSKFVDGLCDDGLVQMVNVSLADF
ncbi:type II toxin-antitoxin system HicB family antitoxin [Leuconostocaceae bacterium ESL0958]|nr:type II toxin-antitoxin system HicB family antitoxin [Leuconostocaceae bacterium ESL0958]